MILAATAGMAGTMAIHRFTGQGRTTGAGSLPSVSPVVVDADRVEGRQRSPACVKMTPPAEVRLNLVRADSGPSGLTILVSASSQVAVTSGKITLKMTRDDVEADRSEVLWSGGPLAAVSQTIPVAVGDLTMGRYGYVATLEFTSAEGDADMAVSGSLYIDVKPDVVLSSEVSFEHIARVQLRQELEERAFRSLQPKVLAGNRTRIVGERANLEALDPGLVASQIRELKNADPNVAIRSMELNQVEVETK